MSYRAAICDDSTTDAEFVGSILHQWAAERGIEVESERFASADAFLFRYAEEKALTYYFWTWKCRARTV